MRGVEESDVEPLAPTERRGRRFLPRFPSLRVPTTRMWSLRSLGPNLPTFSEEALEEAEVNVLKAYVQTPHLRQFWVKLSKYTLNTIVVGELVPRDPLAGEASTTSETDLCQLQGVKPPIVLVHGHGAGVGFWAKQYDTLAEHWTVFALDLVGWGRSDRVVCPGRTSSEVTAWWVTCLEEWRRTIHLDRFTLLGHSLGGFVGARYAMSFPDVVTHLVLDCVGGIHSDGPFISALYYSATPQRLMRMAGRLASLILAWRWPKSEVYNSPTLREYIFQLSAHPRGSGDLAFLYMFRLNMLERKAVWLEPLLDTIEALSAPVTLIHGADDDHATPPWTGKDLCRKINAAGGRCTLFIVPHADHCPHWENHDAFNAVLGWAAAHERNGHEATVMNDDVAQYVWEETSEAEEGKNPTTPHSSPSGKLQGCMQKMYGAMRKRRAGTQDTSVTLID